MWTHQAARLVPGNPTAVHDRIRRLVATVWGRHARTVVDDDGRLRVDAVAVEPGDDDTDVWVSWHLAGDGPSCTTAVLLVVDELDAGPDPAESLAQLLDTLAADPVPTNRHEPDRRQSP